MCSAQLESSVCELVELVELAVWDSTAQKEMSVKKKGGAAVLKLGAYTPLQSFNHTSH